MGWDGPLLLVVCAGLGLALLGLLGRGTALARNPCAMTYSSGAYSAVPVPGRSPFRLLRVGRGPLLPRPVLFVPGYLGAHEQVRSLAAATHNKRRALQFFALDFNGSASGLHASALLAQAAFVNEAVAAILRLYRAAGAPSTAMPSPLPLVSSMHRSSARGGGARGPLYGRHGG